MIDHPTGTLCRCGVSLDLCADCRASWEVNKARMWLYFSSWWRAVTVYADILTPDAHLRQDAADFREGLYLASYKLLRQ